MDARGSGAVPKLSLGEIPNAAAWRAHLPRVLSNSAEFLSRQRWFGDKARGIARVAPASVAICTNGADFYGLQIAELAFEDGGTALYFVPLAATSAPQPEATPLATFDAPDGAWFVVEAFGLPRFRSWFLDQFEADSTFASAGGVYDWQRGDELADYLPAARTGVSRVSSAEQSNTSAVYANALILKAFRKLQPGINPDLEIGRFLAEHTDFRHVPLLVGSVDLRSTDGSQMMSIAMIQTFVPSVGDAWAWTLRHLAAGPTAEHQIYVSAARLLGERTGQLHMALAGVDTDPDFAPEPITPELANRWTAALGSAIEGTTANLKGRGGPVNQTAANLVSAFVSSSDALAQRAAGFQALVGRTRTRTHGDYHLGQVLRTLTEDFVILDFEGEPSRPVSERREKTSPLKDVAGMLRSFNYARGAALRTADQPDSGAVAAKLSVWEAEAREAFLAGYRAETVDRGATFVPVDGASFDAAIAAWELDKAIYEINYELNNRPDWLPIPLSAVLNLL